MVVALLALALLAHPSTPDSLPASGPAARDSAQARPQVVLELPPVEVRALLHDMRSNQTVHLIPSTVLRALPVDRLADVFALQPGVVALGEELHVRGGRHGETALNLDDLNLNEPFQNRPIEVPLYAIRGAELVSGAPEAEHTTGLAGGIDLHSVDPRPRPSADLKWQTDGGSGTHYDQIAGRVSAPLARLGLGIVAAGEGMFDDTYLPALRTPQRHSVAGVRLGWRAENRMSGYLKLAPLRHPERFAVQVLVNRQVHEPYNPNFTLDGWVFVPVNFKDTPVFSPEPEPGYLRYNAADHVAITDDRQLAASIMVGTGRAPTFARASLGWVRTNTVTSVSGQREAADASHRPRYGNPIASDLWYALWGDWPLYRQSDSDVLTLRTEIGHTAATGSVLGGVELRHEQVSMREMDWQPFAPRTAELLPSPGDSIRTYGAAAPGASAWVQGRWSSGGLIMNAGLRADWFTPGPEAEHQTLPGRNRGIWSFGPRLGIAYPLSVRDVFSFSYSRIHQAPGRDYLYDQRKAITNRQPLGNPALEPSTLVSYETAVKRLLDPQWAVQAAAFYRDVFGQVGALDAEIPEGPINLRYVNADDSHALGFEWTILCTPDERRRFEFNYTWMTAWGNESRPEGDPYGPVRSLRTPSIGEQPVSWDRRHSFLVAGVWPVLRNGSISWSTAVLSPLPWTPKLLRQPFTDRALINSRRLEWAEVTNLDVRWTISRARDVTLGIEVRNLFNAHNELIATIDGYPSPAINTLYDDYGAYRTASGLGGGAYWSHLDHVWVPVGDPRLYDAPRTVRASIETRW